MGVICRQKDFERRVTSSGEPVIKLLSTRAGLEEGGQGYWLGHHPVRKLIPMFLVLFHYFLSVVLCV